MWKFFEKTDAVANDDTKLGIALWLLGMKTTPKAEFLPKTFSSMIDHLFGANHFTWRCFLRSCIASTVVAVVAYFLALRQLLPDYQVPDVFHPGRTVSMAPSLWLLAFICIVSNLIPDYLYLLTLTILDFAVTLAIALCATFLNGLLRWHQITLTTIIDPFDSAAPYPSFWLDHIIRLGMDIIAPGIANNAIPVFRTLWVYPAFFTSLWLWLYVLSCLILKACLRFDSLSSFFVKTFDIEKKPIQSIGYVAGCLTSVSYWGWALVHKLL